MTFSTPKQLAALRSIGRMTTAGKTPTTRAVATDLGISREAVRQRVMDLERQRLVRRLRESFAHVLTLTEDGWRLVGGGR